MKNICSVFLVFIAIMAGTGLAVTADQEATLEPPEDGLEINFIKGRSERDLAVGFNHSSHGNYKCSDCHHKTEKDKKVEGPKSCASCHDNFDVNATNGYKVYFKAMHKIKKASRPSCLSCHTKEFGNDPNMTGCTNSACHPGGLY